MADKSLRVRWPGRGRSAADRSCLVTIDVFVDLCDDAVIDKLKFNITRMLREDDSLTRKGPDDSKREAEPMRQPIRKADLDASRRREVSRAQAATQQFSFSAIELRCHFGQPVSQNFFPRTQRLHMR